jgi:predicted helicase
MAANQSNTKGTFAYIEAKIRREFPGTSFGRAFEWLCRYFLETSPKYVGMIDKIWRWSDWPDRWGIDKGIDLVARTTQGKLWAIQAKAVSPDRSVPKRELDSFLSESNRSQFDFRLIIATTDDIGRNARETIAGQQIPVGLILRGDLLNAEIDWPTQIGEPQRPLPPRNPRPHQAAAIRDVVRGFRNGDRGQLVMACGTGKTLTALWIAEKLQSHRTLVLVPSLSLISQTLSEWGRTSRRPSETLVVCSDETVADRSQDAAITDTSDLGVPVTTDVAAITRFLRQRRRGRSAVVFCTYQSSDRIAAAQQRAVPPFDLVIADEAHRCTGAADSLFTTVLDARKIKARRRLFMTATPRYFTGRVKQRAAELDNELASMDDKARFWPVFHRLNLDSAIRDGLLTDYQVVVIGVTQAEFW